MGTTGAPLNLTWPAEGAIDWDTNYVNVNWGIINTWAAAASAAIAAATKGDAGATGPVGLVWAGQWSAGVSYVATNAVYFNGSSYIALGPNVNAEPDTHPSSWALLASQGAQGLQGIQGIPGSGAGVTFPITILQGGTGATDALDARLALGAAASGANSDIVALSGIPDVELNTDSLSMTAAGVHMILTAASLTIGAVSAPNATGPQTGSLFLGQGNQFVSINDAQLSVNNGMTLAGGAVVDTLLIGSFGVTPTAGAGEIAFGSQTSPTASPGGGQAAPGTVLGYILASVAGSLVKIPYYAP